MWTPSSQCQPGTTTTATTTTTPTTTAPKATTTTTPTTTTVNPIRRCYTGGDRLASGPSLWCCSGSISINSGGVQYTTFPYDGGACPTCMYGWMYFDLGVTDSVFCGTNYFVNTINSGITSFVNSCTEPCYTSTDTVAQLGRCEFSVTQ